MGHGAWRRRKRRRPDQYVPGDLRSSASARSRVSRYADNMIVWFCTRPPARRGPPRKHRSTLSRTSPAGGYRGRSKERKPRRAAARQVRDDRRFGPAPAISGPSRWVTIASSTATGSRLSVAGRPRNPVVHDDANRVRRLPGRTVDDAARAARAVDVPFSSSWPQARNSEEVRGGDPPPPPRTTTSGPAPSGAPGHAAYWTDTTGLGLNMMMTVVLGGFVRCDCGGPDALHIDGRAPE